VLAILLVEGRIEIGGRDLMVRELRRDSFRLVIAVYEDDGAFRRERMQKLAQLIRFVALFADR